MPPDTVMQTVNLTDSPDRTFTNRITEESGQNLSLCYQCGNCTASCPYSFGFDIPVSQIMRLLQTGQKEPVLTSSSIWLCASCTSCTTRCPNNIDVAKVMDVLRHEARRQGFAKERRVKAFFDSFLDSVRRHGRVFEMGLMVNYIRKTGRFWTDLELGPKMLPKGKLAFKPHQIQGKEAIARIFERFEKEGF
ncbi:4Fe-4S dicluster domain-containing protein [Pseudodesulfovibrio senegalensis]